MRNTKTVPQDLSLISQEKETITARYFFYYKDRIKQVKYPTFSISNAEGLDKRIQNFKDPNLKVELKRQLSKINSLRRIRGDGNCFFRALAFACISQQKDIRIVSCFKFLNQVCLTCCSQSSIPKEFSKFYYGNFLKFMLEQNWEISYKKCLADSQDNHRVALIKLFDEYPYLDFICILYFRAVCLKGLWFYRDKLKEFLVENEEEAIRTYSEQTEGVSINICSMMLQVVIHVYEIRKGRVLTYHYDQVEKPKGEIHLLFYENHYDLLQINNRIEAEQNTLKESQYYSIVNRKTIKGICIQCNKQKRVFQDSAICQSCFDIIQSAAKRYDKQRLISGLCQDCRSYRNDIVEDMRICKRCINAQNKIQEREKKERQMLQGKTFKKGKCQSCLYIEQIIEDVELCKSCWRKQVQLEQKMQKMKLSSGKKSDEKSVEQTELEKVVSGFCPDCKLKRKDINPELGICAECIVYRKRVEEHQIKKIRMAQSPQKKLNLLKGKKCKVCERVIYSDKDIQMCQSCRRIEQSKTIVRRTKAVCQKCRLLREDVSELSKKCRNCEQIIERQGKEIYKNKKCIQCGHYEKIEEDSGMCIECTRNQKQLMEKIQKRAEKKKDDEAQRKQSQFQRFKLQETKKIPAQKDQYPNRVIDNVNSVKDYCNNCHFKREISRQTKLCRECAERNARPSSTNKTSFCMKCQTKTKIIKEKLCEACYNSSFCTSCNSIKFTELLLNKVCSKCRNSRIRRS